MLRRSDVAFANAHLKAVSVDFAYHRGVAEFGDEVAFAGEQLRGESEAEEGEELVLAAVFEGEEMFVSAGGGEILSLINDVAFVNKIAPNFAAADASTRPLSVLVPIVLNHLAEVGDEAAG